MVLQPGTDKTAEKLVVSSFSVIGQYIGNAGIIGEQVGLDLLLKSSEEGIVPFVPLALLIGNSGKALPVIGQVFKRYLGIGILDGRSIVRVITGGNAQRTQGEVTA